MAAVPVTIIGTMTDKDGSQNVTITGMASLTGLDVGGGPIMPPSDAHPEHPIYLPPGIWPNPPEGQAPLPEHPIVIPPPIPVPPDTPPVQVKVIWTPTNGWAVVLVPTGEHPAPSGRPQPRR